MANGQNQHQTNDEPADNYQSDDHGQEQSGLELRAASDNKIERDPEGAKDEGTGVTWKDDKRSEIFARAREKRQEETVEFSGNANDPNARFGAKTEKDDMGDLERQAMDRARQNSQDEIDAATGGQQYEEDDGQQQQQQQRRTVNNIDPNLARTPVKIVVDGHERLVTVEELAANFQIGEAAQDRLRTANFILQQVKEMSRGAAIPAAPGNSQGDEQDFSQDPDTDGRRRNTSGSQLDVKAIAEKIQLGTAEEAAEALTQLIEEKIGGVAQSRDLETSVLTALENRNAKDAVVNFAQSNPDFAKDVMGQQLMPSLIHKAMAEDLLAAGFSMDDLRQRVTNAQQLTDLHRQLRVEKRRGVRSIDRIMTDSYNQIREYRGQPVQRRNGGSPGAPANQQQAQQQREQRKANLQTQPATRRFAPANPGKPADQAQSRLTAVQQMRKARGQSV